MPKRPRNAFYFFMVDFREERRKRGIIYERMDEVSNAAGPIWKCSPAPIKAKYEAMAKKEKLKNNANDTKYTSNGVPLSKIERQERELKEAEEKERKEIMDFVKRKALNILDILYQDMFVIDVNYYCKVGSKYLFGECSMVRFNMLDGIRDTYTEMINPGHIPIGYASDVKLGAMELGLELPDDTEKPTELMYILANMVDYLRKQDRYAKVPPPIFTMPEKVLPVRDFIYQMCKRAGEEYDLFRVYRLDTVFFALINSIKREEFEGFPKESLALSQLRKDLFKYTPGIGCTHHERSDKSIECTASRAKRWVYTLMDSCCPVAYLKMVPGKHLPFDYDMDSILVYKEQKRGRQLPSAAGGVETPTCDSSMISDFNKSLTFHSAGSGVKRERNESPAFRMPKMDYSQNIRAVPDLTDAEFPKLTAGRGRGRGLSGSFKRLKLDNETLDN